MRHTKEFRDRAVLRARAGDISLLELGWELGVSTTTLRRWVQETETKARARGSAKKVAQALSREKYSEGSQRMRLLIHALEQSPATIIVTDSEGRIIYANPKFVETTGYTVEEVVGKNPRFMKSGHTPTDEYRRLWESLRGGREWRGEFHNRRKDGTLYWERASISPVFNAQGEIANFMAVKENITEFKEADEARRQMEERFRAVVMALAEGVLLVDHDGRIALSNGEAERLLGMTAARMEGRRISELGLDLRVAGGIVPPSDPFHAGRVLRTGKEVRHGMIEIVRAGGGGSSRLEIDARPVPGEHPGGPPSAVVISFREEYDCGRVG